MTINARLYDATGHDEDVTVTPELVKALRQDQLLWIDVETSDTDDCAPLMGPLTLSSQMIDRVLDLHRPPYLDNYPETFAFAIDAPDDGNLGSGGKRGAQLGFIVGDQWLLTVHGAPVRYLADFKAQDKGETKIGNLSPALLTASLLDWHLTQYFAQVADIEAAVDRLDAEILAQGTQREVLDRIVAIRARVSRLRAQLASQRSIFYGFARPDFALNFDETAKRTFADLSSRFDRAIDEVERTREVVVGSFELFTSMTTQQTNGLVKTLTFLTAMIGFCALIAGLLGMNFDLPIFKTGMGGFEVVICAMLALFAISLFIARRRRWL